MLRLVHSNRFEELAAALADDLERARTSGEIDLFTPARVVVPDGMVAGALRLALARRLGIAANVRFPFLDGFLGELVSRARPTSRPLDRRMVQAQLCALLSQPEALTDEALASVRAYLAAADGSAADARRVQLAGELAALFIDYAHTRPDLCAAWTRGAPRPVAGDAPPAELWQRVLWRALFPPGATAAPIAVLASQLTAGEIDPGGSVHIFGFPTLPRAIHPILARLAEACPLSLYVMNPCRELWDDVAGRRPGAAGDGDTPALLLWGRPGREHHAALIDLAQGDFADHFVDPCATASATALARLQRDILDRAPRRLPADRSTSGGDRSIQVVACPGVRRELEVIANRIASLLAEDGSLAPSDVAVLLAPAECERYQAQVGAVFDEVGGLPHRTVSLPDVGESRVLEALDLLLELPLGRFTRPELLGLMIHPAVLARHPDVDRDDWIRWCDELGIVHGADRRDHRGTYIADDIYNWDQGLRRLALGSFMADEPERGPIAVKLGSEAYVPARVAPDERRSAARFALLARGLMAEARAFRAVDRPLAEWARVLDRAASAHIGTAGPADERALDRGRECLRQLAAIDLDGRAVSYATARELLRDPLGALRVAGGELPSDAILVAPLSAARALPFRVLFVAGLDAGRFPAADRESGFDVRSGGRRAGDVSPRDRDRYAFLEAVLSARDRLVLSYVARDEESGEELEPSSVVHELCDMLVEGYLAAEDAAALIERPPLRRWATGGGADAYSQRQRAAAALRRDLIEHCAAQGAPAPTGSAIVRELAQPERRALCDQLGIPAVGAAAGSRLAAAGQPLVLSINVVRRFLECPLQAWAGAVLGLRAPSPAEDPDLVARRDEPFERDLLTLTMSLREVFLANLAAGGGAAGLARLYRERCARDRQAGCAPSGPFAVGAERRGARILDRWRRAIEAIAGASAPPATEVIGFGAVAEGERVARLEPAIELEAGGRRVQLVGRTSPLAGERIGSLVLVTGAEVSARHWLRGAIDAVTLAASGAAGGRPHRMTLVTGNGSVEEVRFAPLGAGEARAWLAGCIEELFGRVHDYLLPCEVSLPRARGRDRRPLETAVAQLAAGRRFYSSLAGPLRLPDGLGPPADADQLIARRFAPLVEGIEEVTGD